MSSLEADPEVPAPASSAPAGTEVLEGAPVALGGPRGLEVTRTLPNKHRRMVGAWCFLDAYGPHDLGGSAGMRVGPHPHIGLQTVSWLVSGEILHRDSLGSLREVRPGQLNLMTAGRGISHSEETPDKHSALLQGVQLWVALPSSDREVGPSFAHHADLPVVTTGGLTATVLMGELAGAVSPATCYSPLVGAEITLAAGTDETLPLRPDFEYAVLTLDGAAGVEGTTLEPGPLLYLGDGRSQLRLSAAATTRLMLIGGEPFGEEIVMWWNFVGRDHEEIVAAREAWESRADGGRFGQVRGYAGPDIPAPPMPITRLVARGRTR
ncbi:pirin family protein [Actinoplanes friuliensis]|uniref:Pirin n=1 Tax=Actinoplanes friuliensis DSM 7358 TaxID=1246995 RepID=U5W5V6_9ACTN|nr:pirin family protein [Actinoplanes friuliensis]AGZ43380.1 pirin [Actinoplanes friuliensis DSM 7358]